MTNTVKSLPKKRMHQMIQNLSFKISIASMIKYQALWYSAFIASYAWFLYWVAYDLFVWHKTIFEVNMVNYVGSVVSIALIWAGVKIWKSNRMETQKQQKEQPQQTIASKSGCPHYLGYLHQRQKSKDLPAECLTCENVIQCFSSTKQ